MASSAGVSFFEYEKLIGSLMEVAKKEKQLADDRMKYVEELTRLTERNEKLMKAQQEKEVKCGGDAETQAATILALEEQNGLLRRMVEEKEDEITVLEKKLATLEAVGAGKKTQEVASGSQDEAPTEENEEVVDEKECERIKAIKEKMAELEQAISDKQLLGAAENGEKEVVKTLLAAGASIEAENTDGWTPLMLASFNGHFEVVQVLLAAGAAIEARMNKGWTSLMMSARYGHPKSVQILLEAGALIDAVNDAGWTALMLAAWGGHQNIVKALLARGADMSIVNKDGGTAFSTAGNEGHLVIAALLLNSGDGTNIRLGGLRA